MSCRFPLWNYHKGEPISFPCGRCMGCRLDRAKEWALRCMNEASLHEKNCFLSLTYRDADLPKDGSIHKEELQKFMRDLRRAIEPVRVRFYGVGEYGEELGRPHYHVLLFGYDFDDKEVLYVQEPGKKNRFSTIKDPYIVYKSKFLSTIWKKGFNTIGEITLESAGYVARYIRKKITGEMALEHYNGKNPEFALMSRRPGIGSDWIKKYMYDCYPKDFTTTKKGRYKPPRFYDDRLLKKNYKMWEAVKEKRKENITDDDSMRRMEKEKYLRNVTKNLKREMLSNGEYENKVVRGERSKVKNV